MSDDLKENINIILERFKDFTNFIEFKDFRDFLLFTLTSQVPSNILAQMGLGGAKDVVNLPYNPINKIYYQKINVFSSSSLIAYVSSEKAITEAFTLKKDADVFKEYMNKDELSMAFRGKEKFLFPKVSDCSSIGDNDTKLNIKVDDLYYSLESFIAITEPNLLFVLDGKGDSDSDLIFAFNMMPEMPGKSKKNVLKIDVYLDPEHKTRDCMYLKREEDFSLEFLNEIKEMGHAELYKASFSLILHVKSLNKP